MTLNLPWKRCPGKTNHYVNARWCLPWGSSLSRVHANRPLVIKYCYKLCIQRQMMVTHICYFMLCQSSLFNTVINFVYKDNCGSMKAFQLSFHWIKLRDFVMQLKRQSVEAWQNEKHYSKGNNTSENLISRQEIFKPLDNVKHKGQVTTVLVCGVFYLNFQAVVSLTKLL